jgi:tRNA threonylcarbamoyladenosine biosynthesis protein TsaE
MEHTLSTHSSDETRAYGRKKGQVLTPETLLCLTGELGAGKTTFVQGLLEAVGALEPYISPTFVIMKQYDLPAATATGIVRIYHVDAYRVTSHELAELGFAEWCQDPQGAVLLEWPERVTEILPEKRETLVFQHIAEGERAITTHTDS